MTTPQPKSCPKQLAAQLWRSVNYVYEMKRCGFPMDWNFKFHCFEATIDQARAWIKKTGFRLVKGKGVVKGWDRRRIIRA